MSRPADKLPVGIHRERGRGYLVEVRVRPFPKERKRFAADARLDAMVAWRDAKQAELLDDKRRRDSALAADADPVTADRGPSGPSTTFRSDVETYLADKLRPSMHDCTKLQWIRWLRQAAASPLDLGRFPRNQIAGDKWAALVDTWERHGIPASPVADGKRAQGRRAQVGPLSPDTVNKIRTCFIGFYRTMDAGLKTRTGVKVPNPAKDIPRRTPKEPEMRGIPMPDALAIIRNIGAKPGSKTQARLTLMCVLGLRPCEIMRIQPAKDWRREARELRIRTAKGGIARTLPLDAHAGGALETLDQLRGWGTFASAPMAKMFHAAVAKAKLSALEPIVPYDLRHSFGTEAYRLTGDIKATGAALGQKTLRMTERYVQAAVSGRVASLFSQVVAGLPPVKPVKRKRGKLRAV